MNQTFLQQIQKREPQFQPCSGTGPVFSALNSSANNQITQQLLQEVIRKGVVEFCICPGSRNAPLVYALEQAQNLKFYYWSEERSAAFFALGRIKATHRPVAVVVTSGTAAGELLPAAMEAHYNGLPLILITADRPRRFRCSGSPQTAEQVNLFGCYAHFSQDIALVHEICDLRNWMCQGPAHLNICLEEPIEDECKQIQFKPETHPFNPSITLLKEAHINQFHTFMRSVKFPLVVLGALPLECRESVIQFLFKLKAPVYAEGLSGVREDLRLAPFRVTRAAEIWQFAEKYGYPIDGILRLGGIPTARLWRDLEEKKCDLQVCSISEQPFSGLSQAGVIHTSLSAFFEQVSPEPKEANLAQPWLDADYAYYQFLTYLFEEEPLAEPSLFYALSKQITRGARIYLGNSLPIREWDLAAVFEEKNYIMGASRGLNGIDGQISTFLGFSIPQSENWGILGDLTTLYDMVAPWILPQLLDRNINLVVVNNSGGQIFSRMYSLPSICNPHPWRFDSLAAFWGIKYEKWEAIPEKIEKCFGHRLIEIIPDPQATDRFWKRLAQQ